MQDILIPTPELHGWIERLFTAAGSEALEARLTADHLVGANLSGHDSHGVGMVPRYVSALLNGELQLNRAVEVVTDTGSIVVLDGQRGIGQSVAHQAMAIAIERVRLHGVAILALRNSHHIGRVGHWAEQAATAGFVSVHFVNAVSRKPIVAPHGGIDPRFNTNPFTVAIPREDRQPILLDFATSAIAQGKVRVAYNKGAKVPPGALIDAAGQPSDDPRVMFEEPFGALLPFGSHKGFGLAMVCELLGGALTGGQTSQPRNFASNHGIWNNMLALLFDPARLGTSAFFESESASFIEYVRSARKSELGEILIPGEAERRCRRERAEHIAIDHGTIAELDAAAAAIAAGRGADAGPLSALARS